MVPMLLMMLPMPSTKKLLILSIALCVALVPAAAFSATTTIAARTSSWGPARVTVERGDTVNWDNSGGGFRATDHTVKSLGRNWRLDEPLPVGGNVTKRFRDVGRYKFRCMLHSQVVEGVCEGMCGVVRVVRPT